jgi:hypothetical protein
MEAAKLSLEVMATCPYISPGSSKPRVSNAATAQDVAEESITEPPAEHHCECEMLAKYIYKLVSIVMCEKAAL